jgi:hypothetical protein
MWLLVGQLPWLMEPFAHAAVLVFPATPLVSHDADGISWALLLLLLLLWLFCCCWRKLVVVVVVVVVIVVCCCCSWAMKQVTVQLLTLWACRHVCLLDVRASKLPMARKLLGKETMRNQPGLKQASMTIIQ